MGCFNITGNISQLPITYGDRVAAFFCKIYSISEEMGRRFEGDYLLYPMLPIMYGEYDDYGGFVPDDSPMVRILEKFFETDIDSVINNFKRLAISQCSESEFKVLHNLVDLRDFNCFKFCPAYKPLENDEDKMNFISNNFCLLFEHEQVVKDIIDSNSDLIDWRYISLYEKEKLPTYEEIYDGQLQTIKKFNLTEYSSVYPWNEEIILREEFEKWPVILFDVKWLRSRHNSLFRDKCMMDLFLNYPSMYHYFFDKNIKKDYIETFKFQITSQSSNVYLRINREPIGQWSNNKMWNRIISTYRQIINKKIKEDEENEDCDDE